ncbi:MAG: hypothetical protein ABI444_11500 [Candidatus Kapaibacterium sp.]
MDAKISKLKALIGNPLFTVLLLLVLVPAFAHAQRSRSIDKATTNGCYRQPVTPISVAPTLRTDMSLNTLIGYIYLDSLMKSLTSQSQLDSLFSRLRHYDTLKYVNKYIFAMSDYDATLFEEYGLAGYDVNPLYRGVPGAIIETLKQKAHDVIPDSLLLRYLVNTSVILHIKVNGVVNDADNLGNTPDHPIPMQCVNAEVIDTIKGKHLMTGSCSSPQTSHGVLVQSSHPCILFSYSPVWGKNTSDFVRVGESDDMSGSNDSTIAVGREYIVFLHAMFIDYDGTHSFYNYWPSNGLKLQGGVFPILSNGNIVDTENLAGLGTAPTLIAFKKKLRYEIQRILSAH